uniref:Uncharacterized protein n=1 Tax=Anguilla anguilla TaxID=7936 RepID=A0A0E9TTU9_ANGAN
MYPSNHCKAFGSPQIFSYLVSPRSTRCTVVLLLLVRSQSFK